MIIFPIALLSYALLEIDSSLVVTKSEIYRKIEYLKSFQYQIRECFSQIVDSYQYGHSHDNFVMLVPTFAENDVHARYFTPTFIIDTKSEHMHWNNVRRGDLYVVVTTLSLPSVLKQIPWTDNTYFTVYTKDEDDALDLFRDFWAEGIINVVALTVKEKKIEILSYHPFNSKQCGEVTEVVQLGTWNRTSGVPNNLFPDKIRDMHKCPLKIILLNRPPSVIYSPETGAISGVEVDVLQSVALAMNATPQFDFLHDQIWTKTFTDQSGNILMHALQERHSDIVAGSLMYTSSVSSASEAIDYLESLCVTFVVPQNKKGISFELTYLFLPQNSAMVIVAAILVLIILCDVRVHHVSVTLTTVISLVTSPLFGGPLLKTSKSPKMRVLLALWLWTCFVFWKIYEAFVSSSIIAPQAQRQMETIDEVLESDLTITGESFLITEVLLGYANEKKLPKLSRDRYMVDEAILKLSQDEDFAYLGTKKNIKYALSLFPEAIGKTHILKDCASRYSPVFQTAKYSPYKKELARRIGALSEFGITQQLFTKYYNEVEKRVQQYTMNSNIKPLTLFDVSGAFLILAVGLLTATVVFIGEKLCDYFTRKSSRLLYQLDKTG